MRSPSCLLAAGCSECFFNFPNWQRPDETTWLFLHLADFIQSDYGLRMSFSLLWPTSLTPFFALAHSPCRVFMPKQVEKNECSIEYKFRKLWISTSVRLYQAVPTATATVKTMYQCSISIFTVAFCPAHSPMYNINQFQCLFLCHFPVDCDLSTENVNSHKNAAQKFIMLQINFIYVLLRGHQIWTAMCSDFCVCQSLHSMAYFRFLVLSLSWVYHTICVICCGI